MNVAWHYTSIDLASRLGPRPQAMPSKHHAAMVARFVAFYNFCRQHERQRSNASEGRGADLSSLEHRSIAPNAPFRHTLRTELEQL
jgi:hypothetical protein